ncbi:E3 ubiquitin-protein ligase listerin [Ceratocystis fimbriata CBS 114723]|uniref:E3 ubiquitin-protein ligase listerin n=1 Tax=Ceratocystis fimbriata CBS 114723 TaxID=1035309 RepID=A0A2C5XAE2_9PEZI|nr:E3 ubiquitin-protein ligase listerin [Ceratocystis fimbriata CBS 114723]
MAPRSGFGSKSAGSGAFSSLETLSDLSYLAPQADTSAISDANVIISFKSLQKKDDTTKTKAMEDLLSYAKAHPFDSNGGVEDAILDAWLTVYARLSIDNSRRVRELAHVLQFELLQSARKRMEKRFPKFFPVWLAGRFDSSNPVHKAASRGHASFIPTQEKMTLMLGKCQEMVLRYAADCLQETKDSLSDERSTKPEDAEAKYCRVISASLSLVAFLITSVPKDAREQHFDLYKEYLSNEKVWESVNYAESGTAKAGLSLVALAFEHYREIMVPQKSVLRKALVVEGLKVAHVGTADMFIRALCILTREMPEVWTAKSNERKSPVSRLGSFMEKGSQHSDAQYWIHLSALIPCIPREEISSSRALKLLDSMRIGMTARFDKISPSNPWSCYVTVASHFLSTLSTEESINFAQKAVLPVFEVALGPKRESSSWSIEGSPYKILCNIYQILLSAPSGQSLLEETLSKLSHNLCTAIASSLPAVSHDYVQSQETVSVQGRRWFSFLGTLQAEAKNKNEPTDTIIDTASLEVVQKCLQVLDSRNLNPFGAAQVLRHAFEHTNILSLEVPGLVGFLTKVGKDSMQTIVNSRTRTDLMAMLRALGLSKGPMASSYPEIWTIWIHSLVSISNPELQNGVLDALSVLVSQESSTQISAGNQELQQTLVEKCTVAAATGQLETVRTFMISKSLTQSSHKLVVQRIIQLCDGLPDDIDRMLPIYDLLVACEAMIIMSDIELGISFITKILLLAEQYSKDERVSATCTKLHCACLSICSKEIKSKVLNGIVRHQLAEANSSSLSVQKLIRIYTINEDPMRGIADEILPHLPLWLNDLSSTINNVGIDPPVSIISPLGCAQFMVHNGLNQKMDLPCDKLGRTRSFRLALFISGFRMERLDFFAFFSDEEKLAILSLLAISAELASDQAAMNEDDPLMLDAHTKLVSFYSEVGESLKSFLELLTPELVMTFVSVLIGSINQTPMGYYYARAASACLQLANPRFDDESVATLLETHGALKPKLHNPLVTVALLAGTRSRLANSDKVTRFCNQLVSEVQGMKHDSENLPAFLSTLAITLSIFPENEVPVPPNRVVFAIRNLVSWIEPSLSKPGQLADIFHVLSKLLPVISLVYGSHWEDTITSLVSFWLSSPSRDILDYLAPIYWSLGLFRVLETIPDPNEDLALALEANKQKAYNGILALVQTDRVVPSRPLTIVDNAILEHAMRIPVKSLSNVFDLLPLISSQIPTIQRTAVMLVRRGLPPIQEEYVADVILEKKTAELPVPLLELLDDPPVPETCPTLYCDSSILKSHGIDSDDGDFPPIARSYLYSWLAVFDIYSLSPVAIRSDYTSQLKQHAYFSQLFELLVDILEHARGHYLMLDKMAITPDLITKYDIDIKNREGRWDMSRLLTHLCFMSLKFAPDVFRRWYLDLTSKQTRVSLESWTSKYISPLLVDSILDDVSAWAENQESIDDDEKSLNVKVSRSTKEISAGYEIDEVEATISIKIPRNFPLGNVEVVGTNRVGVNDKKWQSWVRSTQGVIMFSNGSIIDGLVAFKRNMVGAMKGQSECAICYAIISADKRMPDKRCGTCANFFHKTCLYKWFQTSSQNSCPLCRNPIDYLGADTQTRRGGREE